MHDRLVDVEEALNKVASWAEGVFGTTKEACMAREEAQRHLVKIVGPPHPSALVSGLMSSVGKCIERVEVGPRESIDGVHESEAVVLHFTDGSVLGIDTGSNAWNLSEERRDLKPEDFHVDLRFDYVPPLGGDEPPTPLKTA